MEPPEPPGPTPIPVEGDVQIFADPECTRYADGSEDTVYVRINVPWTTPWEAQDPVLGTIFDAYTDPYDFGLYLDWIGTQESETPYVAGQVIQANNPQGGFDPGYFTQVIITRQ